jgi:hypothetical protein
MHLPIRKVAAKQRFRGRRFIRRLDPAKAVTPAIGRSDEPLPSALPKGDALGLCPLCGMPNGITAKVCWRCEADLSMPVAPGSDADQEAAARDPGGFAQAPGTDRQGAQDAAVESLGTHASDLPGIAPADPTGPVALSDLPRIASVRSGYPTLTQVVQTARPLTTLPAFAAAQHSPKREVVVPAVVAVLAILVAGAYLYLHTSSGLDASWSRTTPGRQHEPGVAPAAVESAIAERTNSPSTPVAPTQDALPKIGESRAAVRARSGKPAEAADAKAPAPAIARASDKDDNMAPSSATPSANAAALTASQRDRVRAASRSANAAGAVQKPDTLDKPRQAPEPRVPCTAAVTALGLCEPP